MCLCMYVEQYILNVVGPCHSLDPAPQRVSGSLVLPAQGIHRTFNNFYSPRHIKVLDKEKSYNQCLFSENKS